jgi:uroporphyrinogen-III decarboxylase
MKRINQDQLEYSLRCIETFCSETATPDFMTFGEDMSYNHGPMISEDMFDEFMAPYYAQIIPKLKEQGIVTIIDSDGGIEPLIPWFERVGLDGILPLERMAGVDVNRIRANHPDWKMIGGFDKTVMHRGEDAMRREFERLLPAMRSGRYIPSVDHQTPPAVSMDDYRLYVELLREYAAAAVE